MVLNYQEIYTDSGIEWLAWDMEEHNVGWEGGPCLILSPPALTPLARCGQHPQMVSEPLCPTLAALVGVPENWVPPEATEA